MATGFVDVLDASGSPRELAGCILTRFGERTDDALGLLVRRRGVQTS